MALRTATGRLSSCEPADRMESTFDVCGPAQPKAESTNDMSDSRRESVRKSPVTEQSTADHSYCRIEPDNFVELDAGGVGNAEWYERRVVHGSLAGTQFEAVEFDEALFTAVDLSKTKWQRVQLRNVRLEKCDLANAQWQAATLQKFHAEKCRGTGVQFLDTNVSDALFKDCKFHLGAFHGSRFRTCRWENCDLREANFENGQLVDVVIRNCDLRARGFPIAACKTSTYAARS